MEDSTNKVLETKIDGLAKLTDERLLNLKDGIAEIKLLMHGFVSKAELDEVKKDFTASVKRIEEGSKKHNEDDKVSFGELNQGQRKLNDTVKMWAGGLAVVTFLVPIALHYFWK